MTVRIAYGQRHRHVAAFVGSVLVIGGTAAFLLLTLGSDTVAGAFSFLPNPVQTIGFLLVLFLIAAARGTYLLWIHPPIEIVDDRTLCVVQGMRRRAFDIARVSGPIEAREDWLGFPRMAFQYDGRWRTIDTKILPPEEQTALRERLEEIIAAREA